LEIRRGSVRGDRLTAVHAVPLPRSGRTLLSYVRV
jgi:hypothetical protein